MSREPVSSVPRISFTFRFRGIPSSLILPRFHQRADCRPLIIVSPVQRGDRPSAPPYRDLSPGARPLGAPRPDAAQEPVRVRLSAVIGDSHCAPCPTPGQSNDFLQRLGRSLQRSSPALSPPTLGTATSRVIRWTKNSFFSRKSRFNFVFRVLCWGSSFCSASSTNTYKRCTDTPAAERQRALIFGRKTLSPLVEQATIFNRSALVNPACRPFVAVLSNINADCLRYVPHIALLRSSSALIKSTRIRLAKTREE